MNAGLSNASFEMGSFKNWDKFPDGFIDYQSTGDSTAKEGGGIGRVQTTVAGRSFAQDVGVAPQPGQSYTFSMWVKSTTSTPFKGTIALWEMSGATGIAKGDTSFTVGSDWTLVSAPLAVTTAGTGLRAQIYLGSTGYDLALDGGSLASGNASGSAKRSVPGLPTVGSATPGNSQVTLSWTAPTTDGGSPITGYVVTPYIGATAQAARTFNSTATTQTITGLTNGTTHTFKVAAKNAVGTGAQSAASNAVTPAAPATAPGAPTVGTATSGNAQATMTWTAPASNGGSVIMGYVVTPYIGATAQPAQTFNSTATTQTITGLTNGTTYTFKVAAKNAVGTGSQSAASASVTPRTVPGAPGTPTASSGSGQSLVTWTAPASNGGSPVTGYVVTPYIGATAQPAKTFNSTATTQTITGLTNGTTYTFKVAAMNVAGSGAQSAASNAVTPVAPSNPSAPFASWDAFVAQQLTDFAGSPGTTSSRASIVSSLSSGATDPDDFIASELNESWFGPHVAPVARLYWAYFGRVPDYSGMTYWAGKHRNGTSISKISQGFANSNEFKTKYGSLSNRDFVLRIYTDVLGRTADPTGVNYWTKKLDSGTSRGQVMINFSESNEYKNKMATKVNVVMLYAGMLHRAPTTGELASGTGTALPTLANLIRLSTAYATRVG